MQQFWYLKKNKGEESTSLKIKMVTNEVTAGISVSITRVFLTCDEWSHSKTKLRRTDCKTDGSISCPHCGRWGGRRKNNPPFVSKKLEITNRGMTNITLASCPPIRVPPETLDHPVLLAPPALALTCLPLLVWVRQTRAPILSGIWGPTRLLETSVNMMLRSMPRSNLSTTRLRTSAAQRDPRRTQLVPAGTWSSATLTGRAVSDSQRNLSNWREKMETHVK